MMIGIAELTHRGFSDTQLPTERYLGNSLLTHGPIQGDLGSNNRPEGNGHLTFRDGTGKWNILTL